MRKVPYPTPGETLGQEFLGPKGVSAYGLSEDIGVPQIRISEVLAGKRAITVDTGLRPSRHFARCFETNDAFRIGLQLDYEAARAEDALAEESTRIRPAKVIA